MAESVSAQYHFKAEVEHTIPLGLDLVADAAHKNKHAISVTVGGSSIASGTLTGASSPAVTKVYSDEVSLVAGTYSIDLAALPIPHASATSDTLDWTGLKVQLWHFAVGDNNTDTVTVKDHTTNGYNIFGDASGQSTFGGNAKGGQIMGYNPENLPDVGASAKVIEITSTDADATVQVLLVAG